MDLNDVPKAKDKYLIVGYPASRTRKNFETRKVAPRPLRYVGNGVSSQSYKDAGISPRTHLALAFDKENSLTAEGPITAPDPDGMSGCGVWRFDSLMSPTAEARDRLLAVFTEHLPREGKLLVATRVSVHVELLRRKWPEFNNALPPAKHFRANVRMPSEMPPNEELKPTAEGDSLL